jgi:ribonucleoside-diphosphate reductase alpha chain
MQEVALRGSVQGIAGIPEAVQRLFVTALDASPEAHVKMQAAFQRHTDNAVSKTINFRNDATREDVARAFMLAYKEGCKGITIYRDCSRDEQVLSIVRAPEKEEAGITPRTRPVITTGVTQRVATGCGNLYVTVNFDEHGICEVFSTLGKAGGCASAQAEAVSRLISQALRSGVDAEIIVESLRGIRCPSIAWENGQSILSCPDAIAGVLQQRIEGRSEHQSENPGTRVVRLRDNPGGQCPECSSLLAYQEGCFICHNCGYTRCE